MTQSQVGIPGQLEGGGDGGGTRTVRRYQSQISDMSNFVCVNKTYQNNTTAVKFDILMYSFTFMHHILTKLVFPNHFYKKKCFFKVKCVNHTTEYSYAADFCAKLQQKNLKHVASPTLLGLCRSQWLKL